VLILAHARNAILGFKMVFVAQVEEGRKGRIDFKKDVTASTAVTAVRAAKGDVLFAEEGKATATAIASLDVYVDLINEFHFFVLFSAKSESWKREFLFHASPRVFSLLSV
jgi:hypothetical protein